MASLILMSQSEKKVNYQSIESVVNVSLECISGGKGVPRDFETFKTLYHPNAKFHAFVRKSDTTFLMSLTIKEFIQLTSKNYEANGFNEWPIVNKIDSFGDIATVFQSYEAEIPNTDIKMRGINTYQMVFENGRWWIISEVYDEEREGVVLPEKYLE